MRVFVDESRRGIEPLSDLVNLSNEQRGRARDLRDDAPLIVGVQRRDLQRVEVNKCGFNPPRLSS